MAIKLTRDEIVKVQEETGWTPDSFMTSFGRVTIPGPPDDYWDGYGDDTLSCGCCECCGCDCWMGDVDGAYFYDDEEDDE